MTVSGNPASFVVRGAAAKVNSLTVPFSPIQSLNGYDHPWPAGGGKNKFNIDKMVNTSDITISNGVITVTGNAKNSTKKLSELADLTVGETYILTANTTGTENIIYLYGTGANVSWVFGTSKAMTQEMLDALVMFCGGQNATSQITDVMIRLASVTDATYAPYSNICPISGRTGLNVWNDPKYGGIIDFNQYADNESTTGNHFAETWATTLSIANGVITATNTRDFTQLGLNFVEKDTLIQSNHVFLCSFDVVSVDFTVSTVTINIVDHWAARISSQSKTYTGVGTYSFIAKTYAGGTAGNAQRMLIRLNGSVTTGDKASFKNCLWFDLTQMFGSTKADEILTMEQAEAGSGVAYFKSLFTDGYYAYNTGTTTCVSAVNGDPYTKVSVDWTTEAGTVYGGTLDVVTGLLTVDMAYVGLSDRTWTMTTETGGNVFSCNALTGENGKALNYNFVCNMYKAVAKYRSQLVSGEIGTFNGTNGTNMFSICDNNHSTVESFVASISDLYVCYELATPLTYQLTPQEVELLVGLNNVWSDTDSVITIDYDVLSFIRQKFIVNGTDFSRFVERDSYQTSLSPVYGETVQTIDGVGHTARLRLKGALRLALNPQTDTDTAAICTELLNSPCEVIYHCLQRDADVAARMTIDTVSASFLSRCLYWGDEWNQIDPITLTEL